MQSKTPHIQLGKHNCQSQQGGFTILELLIAMTMFAIVTGAAFGLMEVARSDRFTTNQRVETMQNVRAALNAIGRDALNAGFGYSNIGGQLPDDSLATLLGLPADTDTSLDRLTPVVAGNNITANTLSGINTDQLTFVFQDESFNNGTTLSIDEIIPPSGQLRIRDPGTNAVCRINDLYIITGQNASAIGMATNMSANNKIVFAASDPLNINQPGASSPLSNVTAPASVSRISWVTYRVLNDGTLVRTVYGNSATALQDMPLAYGIRDMQVQYVLVDGTISDDPGAGPDLTAGTADDTPSNFGNVRQVRVTINARSPEIDRRTNQPFQVTLTSTFNTRNIGYDAR